MKYLILTVLCATIFSANVFANTEECYHPASGNPETSLLEDARYLRVECVRKLIAQEWFKDYYNINAQDNEKKSALSLVSDFGNPLTNESSENYKERQNRALEIGKILVEHGAKIENKDMYGDTPLTLAAFRVPELAKYLLTKGANARASNRYGDTALHHTTDLELIEDLIKHGANVNALDWGGGSALRNYTNYAVNLEASLPNADISKYIKAMEILLRNGANINAGKKTPLGEAVRLSKILCFR